MSVQVRSGPRSGPPVSQESPQPFQGLSSFPWDLDLRKGGSHIHQTRVLSDYSGYPKSSMK